MISLAESMDLQEKLKAANESRIFEDAAARLVERLRGQALPPSPRQQQQQQTPSKPDGGGMDASSAVRLLGPRLAERASENAFQLGGGGNLVEGSFLEYREKRDVEDEIDDVLRDHSNDDDGCRDYDDRADCEL